jgi:hypothetical protein
MISHEHGVISVKGTFHSTLCILPRQQSVNCFLNQSTDMNKDERQRCMLKNFVIRLLVILGNPFYCGLCYALVQQEIFSSYLSVSCYDSGTRKFKECPFIVGGEVKRGNFFLCLAVQKAHMNKCTVSLKNYPLHSPHICYWCPWVSWFHLQRIFLLAFEATYALCPWTLLYLKIAYL